MKWIKRDDRDGEFDGCVFCELPRQADDEKHRVLVRSEHAYAVLNNAPYCPGHTLVVPRNHVETYADLSEESLVDLSKLQQRTATVLRETLSPSGMNIGMNLGSAGGASITDHVHVHVVPRWEADTTFMPVVGNTKVLPEALDDTYDRLRDGFAGLEGVSDGDADSALTVVSDD
jgi:ATP adenylyltransferase